MDSQDQVLEQSTNEQPEGGTSDKAVEQSQTFEVAGQQLSWQELFDKFKGLQAEYTKSRQELSETKKQSTLSDEEKSALEFIKQNGFVTKDDLDSMSRVQQQESDLRDIISSNNDLLPFESAIKELSMNTGLAPEDVIEKYGFKSKDKLLKARWQWDIKGTPARAEKSVSEMSMAEYEKYRQKIGIWGNHWTFG